MAIKRRKEEEGFTDVNVTSLIDVLFVLLIVFMISMSAVVQYSVKIVLPTVVTKDKANTAEIEVLITKDGRIFVGNKELDTKTIEPHLRQMATDKNTEKVIIRADVDTDYGKVMEVMDKSRVAGLDSLSLAVEPIDKKK